MAKLDKKIGVREIMDISQEYIKMCKEAKEINHSYNGREMYGAFQIFLDPPICKNFFGHLCLTKGGDTYFFWGIPEDNIWLPRQDQLQKMVEIKNPAGYSQYFANIIWDSMQISKYYCQFKSMEQLWFAFVMKKKYNKIWDGEQWKLGGSN